MRRKQWLALAAAVCLSLSLTACGSDSAVYVQSVEVLAGMSGIAPGERFAGLVVSENVTEIEKDSEKNIEEVYVKSGDDVKKGQKLFAYDTEQLQLTLDKQRLELEQLNASIENYKSQIATLERERETVSGTDKLQYTVQIQTTQVDLKEAELNVKTKENEVQKSEDLLKNAVVTSPIDGRVQNVSEDGTDSYGNPLPFITIQQIGSYRIKGTIGELQRGSITEGTQIKAISRTDATQTWTGTVALVDYENPTQGSGNSYSGSVDEMTSSSKYPFYVDLESTDGLILGQHLYLEIFTEEGQTSGPSISSGFICYDDDGTTFVWAEKNGKLEKREVTLGEYNPMTDTQEVVEGLALEDYIAFPDAALCREGAPTTREEPAASEPEEMPMAEGEVS